MRSASAPSISLPLVGLLTVLALGAGPAVGEEPGTPPAVKEWTLKDGVTRALVRPEFRDATDLRADLLKLKVPGLRVELVTPEAARPSPLPQTTKLVIAPSRLLLIGTQGAVESGRRHLEQLDVPPRLVSVSALVSEVQLKQAHSRGASLLFDKDGVGDPKGSIFRSFATGFDPDRFLEASFTGARAFEGTAVRLTDPNFLGNLWESSLRMLLKRGEADFLAWPNLLCAEGRPAEMESVEDLPHIRLDVAGTAPRTQLVSDPVGLRMRVTPVRVGDEVAVLDLEIWLATPEVPEETISPGADIILRQRLVRTRVSVRDGEPVLFGGLYLRRKLRKIAGLPRLVGLSLADSLLTADDIGCVDTELLFLVRAYVKTPTRRAIRSRLAEPTVVEAPPKVDDPRAVELGTGHRPFTKPWRAPRSSADLGLPPTSR